MNISDKPRETNYWETEEPEEMDTGRNVLSWYKKAGRLQVSMPSFQNRDGEWKRGKTVAINLESLYDAMEDDKTIAPFLRSVFNLGGDEVKS